jgi:hypothetical protein
MNNFNWFKGVFLLAFACCTAAQGGNVATLSAENDTPEKGASAVYTVSVIAGQTQNGESKANLTLAGENSKVSVEQTGTVIVAGNSILLRPGTRVTAGCFLFASIETPSKTKKHLKKVKLVTIEEKIRIDEQLNLSIAYTLFSPFPTSKKGFLHAGDAEQGSFNSSNNELSAVSPDQQRKVAVDSRMLRETDRNQIPLNFHIAKVVGITRAESVMVLRL